MWNKSPDTEIKLQQETYSRLLERSVKLLDEICAEWIQDKVPLTRRTILTCLLVYRLENDEQWNCTISFVFEDRVLRFTTRLYMDVRTNKESLVLTYFNFNHSINKLFQTLWIVERNEFIHRQTKLGIDESIHPTFYIASMLRLIWINWASVFCNQR